MSEQLDLQDPNITTLYMVTDTIPQYRQAMKTFGAVVIHDSQAVFKLGRFTVRWLDAARLANTLNPVSEKYCMIVLGEDWYKAEERMPIDESLRGWLKTYDYRFTYAKDLRQYEGVGL